MMRFGKAVGQFKSVTPKIMKGIGQVTNDVTNLARNIGHAIGNVRNIGSTGNAINDGRIGASPFGSKMQEIKNKLESWAKLIVNNDDKAQGLEGNIIFNYIYSISS